MAPHAGTYKLEVWGAQGGGTSDYYGGYGGYSVGEMEMSVRSYYVVVGGQGETIANIQTGNGQLAAGGYNGGGIGSGFDGNDYGAGGGGATHISTENSVLSSRSSDYTSTVLIVAGGGGAGMPLDDALKGIGGHGGGFTGGNGEAPSTPRHQILGKGGTQSVGGQNNVSITYGSFGQGGGNVTSRKKDEPIVYSCHGGGGGLYGGSGSQRAGAGGGSGYINTSKLTNAEMYGYGVSASSATATKTYSTSNVSSTATAKYAKTGDGFARITYTP